MNKLPTDLNYDIDFIHIEPIRKYQMQILQFMKLNLPSNIKFNLYWDDYPPLYRLYFINLASLKEFAVGIPSSLISDDNDLNRRLNNTLHEFVLPNLFIEKIQYK